MNKHSPDSPNQPDNSAIVVSRRSFLGVLLGVGGVAVAALLTVPFLRHALYPLYSTSALSKWSKVGLVDSLPPPGSPPVKKQVVYRRLNGWRVTVTRESAFVQRTADGKILVLSAICPHLGCTVQWRASQNDFFCPCHHSVFGPQGGLEKGPAKRGMDPLPTRQENGEVLVHFEFFREDTLDREVVGQA